MEFIHRHFCAHVLFILTLYNIQAIPLPTKKWQLLEVNPKVLPLKKMVPSFYHDLGNFCKNNGLDYLTISNLPYLANMESTLNVMKSLLYYNMMFRYLSFGDIIPQNYIHHQDSLLLLTNSDILLQNEQNFQKYSSLITKVAKIKRAIIVFTTPLTTAHEKSLDMKINIIKGNSLFYIAYQDSSNLVRVKSIVGFEKFYSPIKIFFKKLQ